MVLADADAGAAGAVAEPSGRPPVGLVLAAVATLGASAALFVLGDELWAHALGYVLSTFVLIGLVARYRWTVVRLRANRSYAHNPTLDHVATALVVAGIAVAALHVWPIATELAR